VARGRSSGEAHRSAISGRYATKGHIAAGNLRHR